VQLPGRETRICEEPLTTATDLVQSLSEALIPFLDRDYSVYGHSLGAQVAFALACAVESAGQRLPTVVAVSGSAPPFDPPSHPDRRHWSDSQLRSGHQCYPGNHDTLGPRDELPVSTARSQRRSFLRA
jgi:surfactin synthase thioesterase subunit